MNVSRFLEYWSIAENPFRGEEARHDPVFLRLEHVESGGPPEGAATPPSGIAAALLPPAPSGDLAPVVSPTQHFSEAHAEPLSPTHHGAARHSDFEKICGDFASPASAIVFGEKGSGKTAIRLQLAHAAGVYNISHPNAKCLLVPYDDLNPILDRFHDRHSGDKKADRGKILSRFRLVDHLDAILSLVVPRVIDGALAIAARTGAGASAEAAAPGEEASTASGAGPLPFPPDLGGRPRKWDRRFKRDLLLLQAVYDRADDAPERTRRLRRLLGVGGPKGWLTWGVLAYFGWLIPAGFAGWAHWFAPPTLEEDLLKVTTLSLIGVWAIILFHRLVIERFALNRVGRRLRRQIRVTGRPDWSYAASFRVLPRSLRSPLLLPVASSDEQRFAMIERLQGVLRKLGYAGMVVVIDRVDEPTLISGDPDRMQSVVWPMLNNKFLQQEGLGVKMLLPIELRHALFRESSAFFQEARLDKQNMIERLSWTGATLYDLCNSRLTACLMAPDSPARGPRRAANLLDLFAEDVSKQDLMEALEQMHQPRDAFKLLYQCLSDHCASVTEDQLVWRVPRLVLENAKKAQAERVRQLQRGVRPA